MKKTLCMLLALVLTVCLTVSAVAETIIEPKQDFVAPVPANLENNPVIEGEDPMTGLPASGEPYTPIVVVMNNVKEAYPHWGVRSASIMFQMPNQGSANTKLMALFSNEYPTLVGGTRSARVTMVPLVVALGAAFASAGMPPIDTGKVSVNSMLKRFDYKEDGKYYNLLGGTFRERAAGGAGSNALLAHVKEMHEDMIKKNSPFEVRPFLFTDEPLTRGEEATEITLQYFNREQTKSNLASDCSFHYADGSYTRESAAGINADRETGMPLHFANVIIIRTTTHSQQVGENSYTYIENDMVGGDQAEIFQSGRYISGSWYRADEGSRLILLDENGEELKLQRGKTFIVLTSDYTQISYQ